MNKVMRMWDIVLMNITAILGLRWLPIAASYGASSILLWILSAILFFIPLGLISSELATTWPAQGGMYVWVKEAYGEKYGFLVSWLYWVNSFFFCPAVLIFLATTLAIAIEPNLATHRLFVSSSILIGIWGVTLINLKNTSIVRWLSNISGTFGTLLPGIIVIVLGFASALFWKRPIPTDYSLHQWLPNFGASSNIAFISTLMFSMAGIELTPTLAGETKDPQHVFPKATLISAFFIVGIYIFGTIAMTFLNSPQQIKAASGIMDAVRLITTELHLPFLLSFMAFTLLIGNLGGLSVWIIAPVKMLIESTQKGVLPAFFTRLNSHGAPGNAMIIQAIVVTIITVGCALSPSVNAFYETMVLMTTILYFIPYLFMFTTFLKLRQKHPHKVRPYRVPGGKWGARLLVGAGLFSVLLSIILPFIIPPSDVNTTKDILIYRAELIVGTLLFCVIGYAIYAYHERKQTKNFLKNPNGAV